MQSLMRYWLPLPLKNHMIVDEEIYNVYRRKNHTV